MIVLCKKIKSRIKELGEQITKDYAGQEVTVVGVLNGAFMFCADLIREMKLPVKLEFVCPFSCALISLDFH